MELESLNRKVCIGGVEYDNPLDGNPIPKRDFREFREGARTTVKEIWLERYLWDGNCVHVERSCLQMTNRGVCSLDGRQLKNSDDIEKVKAIFGGLKVADR